MKKLAASNWIRRVLTLSPSSNTYTPNVDNAEVGVINTPAADFTIANPTGTPADGQTYLIRIKSTTAFNPTFGTAYVGGTVALPTTTTANKTITIGLMYDATAAKYVCLATDMVGY